MKLRNADGRVFSERLHTLGAHQLRLSGVLFSQHGVFWKRSWLRCLHLKAVQLHMTFGMSGFSRKIRPGNMAASFPQAATTWAIGLPGPLQPQLWAWIHLTEVWSTDAFTGDSLPLQSLIPGTRRLCQPDRNASQAFVPPGTVREQHRADYSWFHLN